MIKQSELIKSIINNVAAGDIVPNDGIEMIKQILSSKEEHIHEFISFPEVNAIYCKTCGEIHN